VARDGLGNDFSDDDTVLVHESRTRWAAWAWGAAEQLEDRGSHIDQSARSINESNWSDACPGRDERRPRLHDAEGAMLTEMTALITPVVSSRVEHEEVRGGGMIEDLCEMVERVRIRVVPSTGIWH
jgi:hypothetical protein